MSDETERSPEIGFKTFRKRGGEHRLSDAKAKRQGQITTLAFSLLGDKDRALAFLNNPDATLGGRPLDLAIDNPEGFSAVEGALRQIAQSDGPRHSKTGAKK